MSQNFCEKIISEIIETERSYLSQLEKLQIYFSKPSLEKGLLPSHAHSAIFSQLSAIYQMNSKLLEEILAENENIGSAFLKFGPFLKVYSSYANNFQRALEFLQKWEAKSESFRTFISNTETRPEVQAKLPSLLITPIQRIPRYKLLLDELLKYSDSSNEYYQDIEGALKQVREVASHIDRSVYEAQAFNRLLTIQRSLKEQKPSIIIPGRKVIKEGVLNKVSRKGKGSQARLFFLFNDMLMYTKLPSTQITSSHKENSINGTDLELKPNSLECCCVLPLRYCRVITVFGSSEQGITFRVMCSDEDLLLYSSSSSEGKMWIQEIKAAASEALQKRKTLRKVSSRKKALRRTPLKKIEFPEEKNDESRLREEAKSPKFLFEFEALKTRLRSARDCLTPPKPGVTPQHHKKRFSKKSPSEKPSADVEIPAINDTPKGFRPLSPLATCSWEAGSSLRSTNSTFTYREGARGCREGSQLTPSPCSKVKKRPMSDLVSPSRKKLFVKL